MDKGDFILSTDELNKINYFIQGKSRSYAIEDGESVNDVAITFHFCAGLGRIVTVSAGGSIPLDLQEIEI